MLIDTHAHLHFDDFATDDDAPSGDRQAAIEAVLQRAHRAGVEKIMCVGVNETDSAEAVAVAEAEIVVEDAMEAEAVVEAEAALAEETPTDVAPEPEAEA